ncbi:MAG: TlpA family protein disulfide reductase [Winogradskyella sp.]
MKLFHKKFSIVLALYFLILSYGYGQVKVSEFVQESKINTSETNSLYFVDFWATWCVPCVAAKAQLGVLQKQFPKDFYSVSISQENPERVEKYLEKKSTDLAIAIDYNGETFSKYNVYSLPHGILFNAEGKVLWQGGTADLKAVIIAKFLRQQKTKASIKSFFDIVAIDEVADKDYTPTNAIEIKQLATNAEDLQVVNNDNYLKLTGHLKAIVGYLAKIYNNQIQLKEALNKNYEIYFKKPLSQKENLAVKLINEMNFDVERKFIEGEVVNLKADGSKLWDTNQINWGHNTTKYLIDDSQIKADNVSLKEIGYQLSHILDMPIIVNNEDEIGYTLHDWDFHYQFFELMQTDLLDNYGITAKKEIKSYPIYIIQKKAP